MQTMRYYPGGGALRSDAAGSQTHPSAFGVPSLPSAKGTPNAIDRVWEPNQFRFDLTEEQRRLCDWVARQACTGTRHIRYTEATAALDLHSEQLTRMLREMRERLDEIHEMVEAPIVNTRAPYFEVPVQARHIWDNYRRAEQEVEGKTQADIRELELVQS
jgi:hypothetical protein